MGDAVEMVGVGDHPRDTDWAGALNGVHVVVALAARTHLVGRPSPEQLGEYRRVNVDATLSVARQAGRGGVRRFVYLSSIKVNGEGVLLADPRAMPRPQPYREVDPPAPEDAYGISKYEAELGLLEISAETGMEVVIVRPPLVYGPGVRANFEMLMRVVARGIPLPLGAVHNRRSLVALDNLVDFILTCVEHPAAANETFLVSDGEDLSTTELVRRLGAAMGRRARLVPMHSSLLMAGATLLGRRDVARRLLGSLQADISKGRGLLGWTPPLSVDEGLRRTVSRVK